MTLVPGQQKLRHASLFSAASGPCPEQTFLLAASMRSATFTILYYRVVIAFHHKSTVIPRYIIVYLSQSHNLSLNLLWIN